MHHLSASWTLIDTMPSQRARRLIFAFIGMDLGTLVSSMALNMVAHHHKITCYPGLRKNINELDSGFLCESGVPTE